MFFKNNKKVNTEDIKLSDYDQIWSKFCFMDETGDLKSEKDPYFTIGMIKMSQPYYLQSKILYERNKCNFHDEMKFNKLSKNNLGFAKNAIGFFFDTRSIDFYSYTTRKDSNYFIEHFDGNPWSAYKKITLKLLDVALAEKGILTLIADHVTTPKNIRFEVDVKKNFNANKISGSKYKIELLDFIKGNLGISDFSEGFRNRNFNIFVEHKNKKGQSS